MTIHLAADHGGFEIKQKLKLWLLERGHNVEDHGALELNMSDDYTDFVFPAAQAVAADLQSRGIIFGGSGQGEAMAANRVRGARAVVYYGTARPVAAVDAEGRMSDDEYEIVRLSRQHNNSNVLSIGARFVSLEELLKVVEMWLAEPFSSIERHQKRIDRLDAGV